jgi:hypothetical protein
MNETNTLLEEIRDILDYWFPGGDQVALVEGYNSTLVVSYPSTICTNQPFTIAVNYLYGETILKDATIYLDYGPVVELGYEAPYGSYRGELESATPQNWTFNISANYTDPFVENLSYSGVINIADCIGLNVYLWQEREYDVQGDKGWVIKQRNFDKQLDTPYINDFSYIIARDLDRNASGAYSHCHLPVGGFYQYSKWMDEILTPNLSSTIIDLIGADEYIGCDDYWYRAEYISGQAAFNFPYPGNYSLYLLEGVLTWENQYSPPQVVKSNLFIPLGQLEVPNASTAYEVDYYLSHNELDAYGSFTEDYFVIFVILIPVLIIGASIYIGAPMRFALILALGWAILWILIRLAS